jgi:hypothetical protein
MEKYSEEKEMMMRKRRRMMRRRRRMMRRRRRWRGRSGRRRIGRTACWWRRALVSMAMCLSARVVARSSTPTLSSTPTRSFSLWGKDHHQEIILSLNVIGRRKERGWFWPASGRKQLYSTNFIGNQL